MFIEALEPRRVLALPTPSGLEAVVNAPGNVVLTWNDVAGESGYRVEYLPHAPPQPVPWATLTTTGSGVTTCVDASPERLERYYRLIATAPQPADDSPASFRVFPETDYDDPVAVEYVGGANPKLVWDLNPQQTTGYKVSKKTFGPQGSLGNVWYWEDLTPSGPLSATTTEFNVSVASGARAEFKVERMYTTLFDYSDYTGYVLAGQAAGPEHSRGTVIVVVDETQLDASRAGGVTLRPEIDRYKGALVGEG